MIYSRKEYIIALLALARSWYWRVTHTHEVGIENSTKSVLKLRARTKSVLNPHEVGTELYYDDVNTLTFFQQLSWLNPQWGNPQVEQTLFPRG